MWESCIPNETPEKVKTYRAKISEIHKAKLDGIRVMFYLTLFVLKFSWNKLKPSNSFLYA